MCECGKQLQGREENAGRQVLCPSCGREQIIPDSGDDAIQAGETAFTPPHVTADVPPRRPRLDSPREEGLSAGTSGKATTSLILGILSLFCSFLTGIPGVILGILALRDIGRSRGRLSGQGLAIAGIATACVGSLLSCLLLLPALLLPAVQKVREAAAERFRGLRSNNGKSAPDLDRRRQRMHQQRANAQNERDRGWEGNAKKYLWQRTLYKSMVLFST